MEQSIDPNTQPEFAAGTDPAYIPGLTGPRPAESEDAVPEQTEEAMPDDAPEVEEEAKEEAREEEAKEEEEEEGPVFEVSDRRGSITADRAGVRFRLDDQEAEFLWSEIGAVEIHSPRFGRRFTITVHLSSRRWFNTEVEAAARSQLKEWTAELDAVLDAYFEES
ncbi:hypothetical protein ACIHCQ_17450 [Streptomyces sp. NPDC052236]|uniref:hypothetical protein n=1 Tax=Streptomyces sp. NPDC052236 TaxID=3365686 RepID=UPI0037CF130B